MRLVITSVALLLGLVAIYPWGGAWSRNLEASSALVLWYFSEVTEHG